MTDFRFFIANIIISFDQVNKYINHTVCTFSYLPYESRQDFTGSIQNTTFSPCCNDLLLASHDINEMGST